jgi:hypothetical protein
VAASVTVFAKAFGDSRIVYLGKLLGCSWNDAFVRIVRLWSVCAEQQTDKPEVRHIRACLEDSNAELHLVESGLGDDSRRDPSLAPGVCRVRGCNETDWYLAAIEQQGQVEAGKARAAIAQRDHAGRFVPGSPPLDVPRSSAGPASVSGSGSGSSFPDLISDQPLLQASLDLEREKAVAALMPKAVPPVRTHTEHRRKLFNDAWAYAGLKHQELKNAGVDPSARNCWSGLINASSQEAQDLIARIHELAPEGVSDLSAAFARAGEVIRNRVDVAAAIATRDQTLRWFTPARMWNGKSFAIDKDLSPEQAALPRGPRPPSSRPDHDPPPRKIATAR